MKPNICSAFTNLLQTLCFPLVVIKMAGHFMEVILTLLITIFLTGNAIAAEKVSLQLRWDHQFQFAGYYAAQ
jgi:hypothetical protein